MRCETEAKDDTKALARALAALPQGRPSEEQGWPVAESVGDT